ncbi:MAG: hypothetical protein C5B52_05055 [Bacteroidetes bacterium]|nr:MAG: hypothetical protein C5B52_05055 [Bacteroidota bacterium]
MSTRLLALAFLLSSLLRVQAQLSVSLHEPPSGIVQKSQLWNMTLIYSGAASTNAIINLSLIDIRDNQVLMTGITRPFALSKGVRQIKAADVGPIDYNYLSGAFLSSGVGDAFIPIGNYRACYTIYSGSREYENLLAEECINLEIAPLSPPQLNLPGDSAMVETAYPQFNWLPPAPLNLFSRLNYDLLVVEVQAGQTAQDAIQENLPVYNASHLLLPVNNYPASFKSLDTGRIYAWRIIAKNDEQFAAQSDVWTFSIASKKPAPLVPAHIAYLELKTESGISNTALISDHTVGIKFYSYDKTRETSIRFFNENHEVVKEVTRTLEYGNNFLVFKLEHSFETDKTYFIEVKDLQGAPFRASFRITK